MRIVQRFHSARTRQLDGGVRRRRHRHISFALFVLSALFVTGCAAGDESSRAAPATQTPSAESSRQQVRSAILSQYHKVFRVAQKAERVPAGQRRAMLAPYLTEPQLSHVLQGIRELREKGIRTYGYRELHPYDLQITGSKATLHDCQNTSHTGQIRVKTGEKLTRGVKQDHYVITLVRGADGKWRVKYVDKGKRSCTVPS